MARASFSALAAALVAARPGVGYVVKRSRRSNRRVGEITIDGDPAFIGSPYRCPGFPNVAQHVVQHILAAQIAHAGRLLDGADSGDVDIAASDTIARHFCRRPALQVVQRDLVFAVLRIGSNHVAGVVVLVILLLAAVDPAANHLAEGVVFRDRVGPAGFLLRDFEDPRPIGLGVAPFPFADPIAGSVLLPHPQVAQFGDSALRHSVVAPTDGNARCRRGGPEVHGSARRNAGGAVGDGRPSGGHPTFPALAATFIRYCLGVQRADGAVIHLNPHQPATRVYQRRPVQVDGVGAGHDVLVSLPELLARRCPTRLDAVFQHGRRSRIDYPGLIPQPVVLEGLEPGLHVAVIARHAAPLLGKLARGIE
ncbi:hypothetical protein D3C86_385150 [compost metagenome]